MLPQLFPGQNVYEDTDGDGLIDRISARLILPRNLSGSLVWAEAAHVACRWAFESLRLEAPLVRFRQPQGNHPHVMLRLSARISDKASSSSVRVVRESPVRVVATGGSPQSMASFLRLLAVSDALDLPNLPGTWSVLQWIPGEQTLLVWKESDSKKPFLTHRIDPAKAVLLEVSPLPHMSHRDAAHIRKVDLLNLSGPHGIFRRLGEDARQRALCLNVILPFPRLSSGTGRTLCHVLSLVSLQATQIDLPFVSVGPVTHDSLILELREDASSSEALVHVSNENPGHLIVQGSPAALKRVLEGWLLWTIQEPGPGAEPIMALREKMELITRLWRAPATVLDSGSCLSLKQEIVWKAEDLRLEKLVKRLPSGQGPLCAIVFISKPEPVRRRLKARLEKILRAKGYEPSLEVFNAYKPGLCWLLEKVLPALKLLHKEKATRIRAVELSFAPFVGPHGTMETRTRWLQEIYPAPDLLARNLQLDVSRIRIRLVPNQQAAYCVRAWDSKGQLLLEEALSPRWTALPYFGRLIPAKRVHPTTSGIRVVQGSRVLLDRSIPTDREVFWRVFGNRWLPALLKTMERRVVSGHTPWPRAFWQEIRIDVIMEETEKALDLDQERLSPMEALHEDVYFTMLDAYKDFAERHGLSQSLHLGQIMPFVAWKSPRGRAKARFEARPFTASMAGGASLGGSTHPQGPPGKEDGSGTVWLRCHKRHWHVGILLSSSTDLRAAHNLANILPRLGLECVATHQSEMILRCPAPRRRRSQATVPQRKAMASPPTDRILSMRDVAQWVRKLSSLPGLRFWEAAKSFQGRPVWALEAALPCPSPAVSQARLRLLKPTLVFNARHHANEVSSTEAALFSAWTVGATDAGRAFLRKVNLLWIPAENVDGVTAFERLFWKAPGHKLHAARYNALGCEFYEDYFLPRPRFPEALAKRRAWERWLPEMILDGHGVPSHEWNQPFSGYLPGMFAEHWIPRAFLYVYLPYLNEPENPCHSWALRLAQSIQRHVHNDADLVQKNDEIRARYHRYAQRWEPQIFPFVTQGPVALLPPVARVAQLHYSAQWPRVTRLEVVTEVVDEVAEGPWLNLCVQGHLAVWKAMIEVLQARAKKAIKTVAISGRRVRLSWGCESMNPT